MPASEDKAAWERLGQLLTRRRVELDPRYANLELFAAETGINWRMAWDIERARRTNFGRASRVLIEVAYGLEHGSIDDALRGAPLRARAQAGKAPSYGDPALQRIWETPGLTEAEKLAAITAIRDRREKTAGFTEEELQALREFPEATRKLLRRDDEDDGDTAGRSALPGSGGTVA